jgi:hypothetical protein
VGDIIFKVIFAAENSNKFHKTRFWKEKSVKDVVTLGPMAQANLVLHSFTSLDSIILLSFKLLKSTLFQSLSLHICMASVVLSKG